MNQLATIPAQQHQPAPTTLNVDFSTMERIALAIAKGGLFGSSDPNAVLTLCMLAHAEGQHPAVVFRDYHLISGKPAKKSEAMQRDFLMAGGSIEWHRIDDECVDATFSHPRGGSARIVWDNARVAQAQLGGNPMHKKYPRQMKKARVVAEGVRTVWPSATSGLYETGEVQDMVVQDGPATPAVPQPQRARDLKRVEKDADPGRAKAEKWVAEQLAAVEQVADMEGLDAVMANGHKAVTKLARDHHDLHTQVQAAYEAKASALNGYSEGPADSQRGETHTATDAQRAACDKILKRLETAILADARVLDREQSDFDAMPEEMQGEITAAVEERRGQLQGGER